MRNFELEKKIAEEEVCGVSVADIKREMFNLYREYYSPSQWEVNFDNFVESSKFMSILDFAAFAAQCAIRRANGLEVPCQNIEALQFAGRSADKTTDLAARAIVLRTLEHEMMSDLNKIN